MGFFNVTIERQGSLANELEANVNTIKTESSAALNYVGAEMITTLQKHIKDDWYAPWKPKSYKRRTDHPEYGTPLGSESNMSIDVTGLSMTFDYEPDGTYQGRAGNPPNEIIQSIQKGTVAPDAPERPFWYNFFAEEMEGKIMQDFLYFFDSAGFDIKRENDDFRPDSWTRSV